MHQTYPVPSARESVGLAVGRGAPSAGQQSWSLVDERAGLCAYLVVDAFVDGRAMGGVRMTPDVTPDQLGALSHRMSVKLALAELSIGGAKAGIVSSLPHGPERDRVLRAFGLAVRPLFARGVYLGSDQGIGYRDRDLIFDAAGFDLRQSDAREVLPCSWAELWDHCQAVTGYGISEATCRFAEAYGLRGSHRTASLQGFGTVGRGVARSLVARGWRIVAVADRLGTLACPQGLPLEGLLAATRPDNTIDRSALPPGIQVLGLEDAWLDVPADVLVLAATERALNSDNARRVQARFVVEGANLPCSPAALDQLAAAAVPVVPDILANCGGAVITGLFLTGLVPRQPTVAALVDWLFSEVARRIGANTETILERWTRERRPLHEIAIALAEERLDSLATARVDFRSTQLVEEEAMEETSDAAVATRERARSVRDRSQAGLTPDLDHAPVGRPTVRLTDPLPAALPPAQFVQELTDTVLKSPAATIGPFYDRLIAEEIPIEGIREWVKQWYFDARQFPSVIAQITANALYHYDARQFMGTNLAEELGEFDPAREHPVTVRKLGRALGVSVEEMEFVDPYPETLLYVEYRQHLVRDYHWLEGLGAGSFAIELAIPDRFRRIARALRHQFQLDDDALEVFGIHAGDDRLELNYGGDVKHSQEAAHLIEKYAVTAEMQERVRLAVWRSIEARKVYQWGLYREIVLKRHPAWKTLTGVAAA